ncbi:hypothetical protein OO009_10450 [Flavobacteriaceae bacterium KMM 6897]|nr:hypothetical protein [Flavobacteriaceae bacterium KMM 6897]
MKIITSEINLYLVHFQSGGTDQNHIYSRAFVKCFHDDDFVVQINFYPENKNLPENHNDKRNKLVYLNYPMSMYPNVIDLLRNEKPIYFSYSESLKMGYLRTGKEPIGEGSPDADFN